jgi:hypothetical protein
MTLVYSVAAGLRAALKEVGRIQNGRLVGAQLNKAVLRELLRNPDHQGATVCGTEAAYKGNRGHRRRAWYLFLAWLSGVNPAALPANDDEDEEEEQEEGGEESVIQYVEAQQQQEDAAAEAAAEAAGVVPVPPRPLGWIDAAGAWYHITNDPTIDGARIPSNAVDESRRLRFPSYYTPAQMRDLIENGRDDPAFLHSKYRTLLRFLAFDIPQLADDEEKREIKRLIRAHRKLCKRQIMFGGRMLNEKLWRARNETDVNENSWAKPAKGGTPAGRQYEVCAMKKLGAGIEAADLVAEMELAPVLENARPDFQVLVDAPPAPARTTLFVQVKGIAQSGRAARRPTPPWPWRHLRLERPGVPGQ